MLRKCYFFNFVICNSLIFKGKTYRSDQSIIGATLNRLAPSGSVVAGFVLDFKGFLSNGIASISCVFQVVSCAVPRFKYRRRGCVSGLDVGHASL